MIMKTLDRLLFSDERYDWLRGIFCLAALGVITYLVFR